MDKKKIYIVTSGDYSDYGINAVFSTKEKAEEFMDTVGSDSRIEEYSLDEPIKREVSIWGVTMEIGTKEVLNIFPYEYRGKDIVEFLPRDSYRSERLLFSIESDSKERAIKIASERFGAVIANENTIYPLLRVKAVRNKLLNHLEYPKYNFKTGEIICNEWHVLETSNN